MTDVAGDVVGHAGCLGIGTPRRAGVAGVLFAMLIGKCVVLLDAVAAAVARAVLLLLYYAEWESQNGLQYISISICSRSQHSIIEW